MPNLHRARGRWSRPPVSLAFVVALALAACGAPPPLPEDELFREASLSFEEESYNSAITSYRKLLEEYPFSDKAEVASLNIAYAYYVTGEYQKAIASFNDFERLYPVSRLLPFVAYTIGMCWLDQARGNDRDDSSSEAAMRQFDKVVEQFPNTIYADLSAFRAAQARENLAAHEIVVGNYYRERNRLEAAAARYRHVLEKFPTTEAAARAERLLAQVESAATLTPAGDAEATPESTP